MGEVEALVLDSVSSPITRRVYNMALDEFYRWFQQEPRPGFTKATVSAWRVALEDRKLGLDRRSTYGCPRSATGRRGSRQRPARAGTGGRDQRSEGRQSLGVRVGNWLSLRQAQALLNAPDITTKRAARPRHLRRLLGCGLRRSEVAALTMDMSSNGIVAGASWIWSESTGVSARSRCQIG